MSLNYSVLWNGSTNSTIYHAVAYSFGIPYFPILLMLLAFIIGYVVSKSYTAGLTISFVLGLILAYKGLMGYQIPMLVFVLLIGAWGVELFIHRKPKSASPR